MPQSFAEVVYIFFIYGFLGWCLEVVYAAFDDGMFVNRGFLAGPICPIYGVGVLIVSVTLNFLRDHIVLLFFASIALATLLELVVGWVLERFFDQKWWDYSHRKFNFKGYICLTFSLVWGVALTLIVKLIHPLIMSFIRVLPSWGVWVLAVLGVLLFLDFIQTLAALKNLERRLAVMDQIEDILRHVSDSIGGDLYETAASAIGVGERVNGYRRELSEIMEKNKSVFSRFSGTQLRLLKAFPHLGKGKHRLNSANIKGYFGSVRKRFDDMKAKIMSRIKK